MRWLGSSPVVLLTVAAAGLLASCSSKPWWWQAGASSCGPPALVRVGGRVITVGACSGNLMIPAQKVTVQAGEQIDVHVTQEGGGPGGSRLVPTFPLPHSSLPAVLARSAVSDSNSTGTYRAVHAGRAELIAWTSCATLPPSQPRTFIGNCPLLQVTVVP